MLHGEVFLLFFSEAHNLTRGALYAPPQTVLTSSKLKVLADQIDKPNIHDCGM